MFTTDAAKNDVLQRPSSSTKTDVGRPAHQGRPGEAVNAAVGINLLAAKGCTLAPL